MEHFSPQNVMVMFLSLAILLGVARILGECAQRLRQPAVLGELLAGVLLGPTALGTIAPELNMFLFPLAGPNAVVLDAITTLSAALFLLVAGMEVDLSTVWMQGKAAFKAGSAAMVIPFALGLAAAWLAPEALGKEANGDPLVFALFVATALSISALPVIARVLRDLNLYRSDLGMIVVSAAIFNDLIGWIVFAIILGLMGAPAGHGHSILATITLTLAFTMGMLTLGRWLIHKTLPYLQAYTQWPGGVLSFALVVALLGAACTEWIGIHAIFGAFLAGVAVGDSPHLRERTRVIIDHFVSFVFAPLFFASIGLKVNFFTHFDAPLVLTLVVIACVSKLAGGALGARWGGMAPRDAWAFGFAMNARGAMEIILGLLALEAGIIRQRLFVALVIMAMVTSMLSGPAMRLILRQGKVRRLIDFLTPSRFMPGMKATSRSEAIHELTALVCEGTGLEPAAVAAAVWAREEALPTGIGNGVAIPHARMDGLREPVVAVGISQKGIDFDAPDDPLANVIFLMLFPSADPSAQLELGAELARMFQDRGILERTLQARNFTEFLAVLNSIDTRRPPSQRTE